MRDVLVATNEAGGNAVRVWVHADSANTPIFTEDGYVASSDSKGTLIPDIRRYLRWAQELNLLVVLCLWNAAVLPNSRGAYGLIADASADSSGRANCSRLQSYIERVLTPMVSALADEPALGAWEILNEPEGSVATGITSASGNLCFDTKVLDGSGAGWAQAEDKGGGPPLPMESLLRFVGLQAAAIHAADPQALVTTGSWNERALSDRSGGSRQYFSRKCLSAALAALGANLGANLGAHGAAAVRPHLDFYQTHAYAWPPEAPYAPSSPFNFDSSRYGLDAPLVVGEFAPGEHSGGLTTREQYTTLLSRGHSGALGWSAKVDDRGPSLFEGMRAIREAPAVRAVRMPALSVDSVPTCPPTSTRRRRDEDDAAERAERSEDGWTPGEYLVLVSDARNAHRRNSSS
jgi:mannan endo-1,4-beta-mannosidase